MDGTMIYYQIALSQLDEQEERNRATEAKMSGLIGVAAMLVGIAVIVLKDFSNAPPATLSGPTLWLAGAIAVTFVVVLGFGVDVLRPRKWRRDPDLKKFAKYLQEYEDTTKWDEWAGDQARNAVEANEELLNGKLTSVTRAIVALAVLVLLLVALTVVTRGA